ncbi:hypothetical protein Ais01nite_35940 [Asanoa ishikariensis]|uniref:Glycosyltransferase involved in cell wall bisynthesis n=1 Tax=Asanoa ishikariensis TaxID=137265 RepID=A0A1H3LMD1_9ACTN|nr:glycosyltransferase [Asanoa ishikariensis]GIF65559.1 hypothetical protein Ais01nite_35940 [Asanoa ishikariensis]SDY65279.1 Glycosyltransferase involved in cell wall bisynthesis [Asanoa ishikariensis]
MSESTDTAADRPRTLVLVPSNNEADGLVGFLSQLHRASSRRIVVIDDASDDATAAIGRAHNVEVLSTALRLGRDGAIRYGLERLLADETEQIVFVDGDGQHPPGSVDEVEAALINGATIVNGARFSSRADQRSTPADRVFMAHVLSAALARVTGWDVSDPACGLVGIKAPTLRRLLPHLKFDAHVSVEILVRAAQSGISRDSFAQVVIPAIYDGSSARQVEKYRTASWEDRLLPRLTSHIRRLYEWLAPCYSRLLPVAGVSVCDICSGNCRLTAYLSQ